MPEGIVTRSTGKQYAVLDVKSRHTFTCTIKGKLRLEGVKTTNPVAVGDRVDYEIKNEDEGVIVSVLPRKNYIIRKSVNLSKQAHIIASNVDQCFLVVTIDQPPTSTGFIDRFLVTAEAYAIPVVIVFNKSDLLDASSNKVLQEYIDIYKSIGYDCEVVSAVKGDGIDRVRHRMKDKVSMFSGHSGVGKSSIMNAVMPGLDLKTSGISSYHSKGQHTTTYAEMFPLEEGGMFIDTPGIKGFGLIDIERENLYHYFPEMFRLSEQCKFHNCVHLNEPGCAVKAASEDGRIAPSRYINYINMYSDLSEDSSYRIDPSK